MSQEKRKHLRTRISLSLQVRFDNGSILETETWDISDGGLGIIIPEADPEKWHIGDRVQTKVLGLPFDAPELAMEVVRIVNNRIGLQLIGA